MAATTLGGEKTFERVKVQLKARLGGEVFSSWFGRMKLAEASKGVTRLSVPTAFLRSWINGHYLDLISELWRQEEPDVLKVEIIVRSATRQDACRSRIRADDRSKSAADAADRVGVRDFGCDAAEPRGNVAQCGCCS